MASKKLKIPGGTLINGVLIADPAVRKDRDAPNGFGRKFGEKHFATPNTVVGQRNQTKPSHAFVGGATVDDEICDKLHIGKQAPVAFGMKSRQHRGKEGDGFDVLRKASDTKNFDKIG